MNRYEEMSESEPGTSVVGEDITDRLDQLADRLYGMDVWTCRDASTTIRALRVVSGWAGEAGLLRTALQLAVGELSTHAEYERYSPDMLLEEFIEDAAAMLGEPNLKEVE